MPSAAIRVIDVYPYRRLPEGRQEFLVLRRSPDQRFAGQWRMVGGKIEEGETAWEAALRECIEEVGQQPRQFWALPSVNTFYDWQRDKVNIVPAFAAELEGDPVLNYEHDLFKWLDAEAAADLLVWPEQQRLLQLAAKILNEGGPIDELIVRSVPGDEER